MVSTRRYLSSIIEKSATFWHPSNFQIGEIFLLTLTRLPGTYRGGDSCAVAECGKVAEGEISEDVGFIFVLWFEVLFFVYFTLKNGLCQKLVFSHTK